MFVETFTIKLLLKKFAPPPKFFCTPHLEIPGSVLTCYYLVEDESAGRSEHSSVIIKRPKGHYIKPTNKSIPKHSRKYYFRKRRTLFQKFPHLVIGNTGRAPERGLFINFSPHVFYYGCSDTQSLMICITAASTEILCKTLYTNVCRKGEEIVL